MARLWRAYHPELHPSAGARLVLEDDEAHHVVRVLRLQPGESIAVFDGRGSEWRGRIVGARGGRVEIELDAPVTDPIEPDLELRVYQGLCKPDRMAWLIQKATELGVAAIHPLVTRRSEGRVPDERRLERWRRIAVEACKQSGRRTVPGIEVSETLPDASGRLLALVLDPLEGVSLGHGLADRARPDRVWLAIGPESGFAEDELQAAEERGWQRVGLGPRILRTETAGLVAATVLLHRWGDLGP